MENYGVKFKGTRDGVIVRVNGNENYKDIRDAIVCKLEGSRDFFKNSKIYLDFSNAGIDENSQEEIKHFILENYGVQLHNVEGRKTRVFNGIHEGRTKFIMSTIRSGQDLEFPGNVVIIGDINAGSQVRAGGNIIVLGTLRGVVHAGVSGNEKAIIAAYSLQPTQLRIAGIISRPPDGETVKPRCPELARVKDGYIIIEPYAPNKYF